MRRPRQARAMWPMGHLAVGYLLLAAERHRRVGATPGHAATLVVAAGTQLPDVVDKPLAWTVPLLPSGRSLAHSLLVAALVTALVWRYAARRGRPDLGAAFGVGYLSHLAADALGSVLAGEPGDLVFLGWPLLPPLTDEGPRSIVTRFADLAATLAAGIVPPLLVLEAALVVAAVWLWARQGYPGLARPRGR